jgi:hypothetical protein
MKNHDDKISNMQMIFLVGVLSALISVSGCSYGSGGGQSAFYHNNREHQKWVANPGHKPSFRNPITGQKLFY